MIPFKTKQDRVADFLREKIISGEFKRGSRLKQIELSELMGVSVTPVREALRVLEAEGYVISEAHRGVVIPEIDFGRTKEVLELRVLLESRLTSVAIKRISDYQIRDLKELQQKFREAAEAGDPQALRATNYRFHFHLYELAGNPQTLEFVRVLWAKYPFTRETVRRRLKKVVEQHELFLARLCAGEHESAVEAMRAHVGEGYEEISHSG